MREMGLKVAEAKALAKKELFWPSKGRTQRSLKSNNLTEAISLVNGVVSRTNEDGVVRLTIVVRKEDLKQMIEAMRGSENNNAHRPSVSPSSISVVERRLNDLLKRRHLSRVNNNASKEKRRGVWCPVLQSIPE